MLSHSKKFIFIHVPKAAGSSIRESLSTLLKNNDHATWHHHTTLGYGYHVSAEWVKCNFENEFSDYFTFGFVRNPWSRAVSQYQFASRLKTHPNHHAVKDRTFREVTTQKILIDDNQMPDDQQWRYLCDKEKNCLVDFVGRFENIKQDWDYVTTKLGVSISLPMVNASSPVNYRDWYDEKTKKIVAENYADDIKIYDYVF